MAGITTAMLASYKRDLLSGLHSHNQSRTFTGTTTLSSKVITAVSALTGLAVGNGISNANFPAGTIVKSIDSGTQITASDAATAAVVGTTITTVGDIFKLALFKAGIAGTYGVANTSYADMGADETSGTGYVAGGTALTNVDPVASSPSAYTNFSPNPSWTSASFSTIGGMIWNTIRNGPLAQAGVSVHDFGGTQTVAAGTFTAVMPVAAVGTAILQIT